MLQCKFLSPSEFDAAKKARLELGRSRGADPAWLAANKAQYGWASLRDVIPPGSMWFSTWYFDPADPDDQRQRQSALADLAANKFVADVHYLSKFYWTTWSEKRPPISVLCPNGAEWCVDAKSSNGFGWTVVGEPPLISCTPSIDVPGYHGFLGINGAAPGFFTPDLAGRGPNKMGLPR